MSGTSSFTPNNSLQEVSGSRRLALYGSAATRQIEQQAAATLPHHTLMSRAGLAVAKLAQALQPHAHCIWLACGPGNNGGDGLVAAVHLHHWAQTRGDTLQVVVTHACQDETHLPPDARLALQAARDAGVAFADAPPRDPDLAIDALLGIGPARPLEGVMAHWTRMLRESPTTVLCVDLPTGLDADTGALAALAPLPEHVPGPRHTLSLLTLKPGLFTASGRNAAGTVWLDELGVTPDTRIPVTAWLAGRQPPAHQRPHTSHKGSYGDVLVLGGQGITVAGAGMTGAAVLAARAALHAGAGRVFVGLLEEPTGTGWDPLCPELMFRQPGRLLEQNTLAAASVVCGCGGGTAVAALLPRVLAGARTLVLDADALNAIAMDTPLQALLAARKSHGFTTVITPHPLEAARLLGGRTQDVMADRLRAAQALADRFKVDCVLKGSGSVLASPDNTPLINPTGNALLATAGTGDVLAGMIGAALAPAGLSADKAWERVAIAVHQHGWLAEHWSEGHGLTLSASRLAARVQPWN